MINLKKTYLIAFVGIATLFSCEKEDFCDGQVATPNMRIKFLDRANAENPKPIFRLACYAQPQTPVDSVKVILFSNTSEIQLPLNINSSQTIWNLELTQIINNDTIIQTDQLIFNYTPNPEYVSKACGYKTIFSNLTSSLNTNGTGIWITDYTPLTNNIINEENHHAEIYY